MRRRYLPVVLFVAILAVLAVFVIVAVSRGGEPDSGDLQQPTPSSTP